MYTGDMKFTKTLVDDVSVNSHAVHNPDAFGIEVELEGVGLLATTIEQDQAISKFWTKHNDGSLRKLKPTDQCIEYVSKHPLGPTDTARSVDVLFDFLNREGCQVYNSYRTSIHVHVNMVMEPFRVIYNFITLCLMLDELLVSQNGDHRIGNNFCLRAKDAMGQVTSLINSIESGQGLYGMGSQAERYSSINFTSLFKFGSVEFRSLECTTHKGRLMHWINTLGRIKEVAKNFENPSEIIARFSQMGPQEFLYMVLGPYAVKYVRTKGYEEMLSSGMRIAQDLAYCSAWNDKANAKPQRTLNGSRRKGVFSYTNTYEGPAYTLDEEQPDADWGAQMNPALEIPQPVHTITPLPQPSPMTQAQWDAWHAQMVANLGAPGQGQTEGQH